MAGFDHRPPEAAEPECLRTAARNARHGLWLFAVYLLVYGGFVGLNAFRPDLMERTPIAGVNLAILYGFGLIVVALVLALVYGWLCRWDVSEDERRSVGRTSKSVQPDSDGLGSPSYGPGSDGLGSPSYGADAGDGEGRL